MYIVNYVIHFMLHLSCRYFHILLYTADEIISIQFAAQYGIENYIIIFYFSDFLIYNVDSLLILQFSHSYRSNLILIFYVSYNVLFYFIMTKPENLITFRVSHPKGTDWHDKFTKTADIYFNIELLGDSFRFHFLPTVTNLLPIHPRINAAFLYQIEFCFNVNVPTEICNSNCSLRIY